MSRMQLPPSGFAEDFIDRVYDVQDDLQIVTFSISEKYGVMIHQVQEIIRVGNITTVPNAPSYMEGVINLRGRILPVLNIRKKLRLPLVEMTKHSRIIVTEVNGKLLGLLVDSVSHVVRVQPELVESAPEEVLEVDTDYITGVIKFKNELIILLDLEKLLRKEKVDLKEIGSPGGDKLLGMQGDDEEEEA